MQYLSAVIITYNEEKNIQQCITSLQGVADEIIVVDSFSTDSTPAICKANNVKFVQQKWLGYGEQKNYGQQLAANNFILSMDADEALDEKLRQSILNAKNSGLQGAYSFKRLNFYYGKFIRHGWEYPDIKVRIFNKNDYRWNNSPVHEILDGIDKKNTTLLKGDLLHFTYQTIDVQIEKINRYTSLSAQDMFQKGKKGSIFKMAFSPWIYFFIGFFLRGGFLDGYQGFTLAKIGAFATFLKYFKLRKLNNKKNLKPD